VEKRLALLIATWLMSRYHSVTSIALFIVTCSETIDAFRSEFTEGFSSAAVRNTGRPPKPEVPQLQSRVLEPQSRPLSELLVQQL